MNKKVEKFLKVALLVALFLSVGIFNSVKADNTTPTVETVTASSATMVYGSAVPTITAIYSPSITTPLAVSDTCSTVATSTSPVGSYTSTCSGASDPNYTFNSYTNGSVSITQATPTITWSNPADIISGTALSATQLNATASVSGTSVPGTFAYTPDVGTILSAGTNQTLSVTFTPTDTVDFTTVTSTTTINVTAPQSSGGGSSGGQTSSQNVNLTIRDGSTIVFSGLVPLETPGTINLNDASGTPRQINSDSVLSMLNDAQKISGNFTVSKLTYYTDYGGSFYLNCIKDPIGNECDNWLYVINNVAGESISNDILTNGENVYLYFSPNHQFSLSSSSISTTDTLTVTAQNYHYQDNTWVPLTGVTIGLTQPDPNNPYSPKEIRTAAVDANGKATFTNIPIGSYNVGIQQDYYYPTEPLTVTAATIINSNESGGGGYITAVNTSLSSTKPTFNASKAFDFLTAQQKDDGSFGSDLYTDWTGLAFASGDSSNYQSQVSKLVNYLKEDKIEDPSLTDSERHAMALMALGLNPYNVNGENYISNITASFDGKQFGDPKEDNDDIFALIVLQNAGYSQNDQMISKDISFVLSAQNADGSWDSSVDMTGAAMEALSSFNQNEQIKDALTKAENYLKQNQKSDGSWNDNASSTAWAMEGILAQGKKISDWTTNSTTGTTGNTPLDYLATIQDTDGGVKDSNMQNKIWETAYVASALSGKTWNQVMQKFEKEETPSPVVTPKVIAKKHVAKKTTPVTKTSEKIINTPKIENQANKNSVSAINAVSPSPATSEQTGTPRKNWFSRLMDKIFGSH